MTFRYTRNGALRFLRIGRVQLSWCICKPVKRDAPRPVRPVRPEMLALDGLLAAFAVPVILAALGVI